MIYDDDDDDEAMKLLGRQHRNRNRNSSQYLSEVRWWVRETLARIRIQTGQADFFILVYILCSKYNVNNSR